MNPPSCHPVGPGGLPPRRLSAAFVPIDTPAVHVPLRDSIVVEHAKDKLLEYFERELQPKEVRDILAGAINGESDRWEKLYQAMLDTWPRLQKNIGEIQRAVRTAPWKIRPFVDMGEEPSEAAASMAQEVERMLWSAKPNILTGEKGFPKLLEGLALQYFTGLGVHESEWHFIKGAWRPRAYREIPARFYGYPFQGDQVDRLMLRPDGGYSSTFSDFPEHRFVVAINGGHPGHPSTSAPLRALTAYWLAAVFGWKWFMQFAQLFGVPFRWATYAQNDETTKNAVAKMLRDIGSGGFGAGPAGTTVNTLDVGSSGSSLPQAELIRLADEQCDIFILGQTLTSSVGDSGSRALGDVHAAVKKEVVEGVCDFVGDIISGQLIPAWTYWNTGGVPDELPEFYPVWPEPRDEKAMAERDKLLGLLDGTTPVSKAWFYERHNIPAPRDDEPLLVPVAPVEPDPSAVTQEAQARLEASDWSGFAEHHGGLGIRRAEMPQIAAGNRSSMVQYLKARGIESVQESVLPATLKATQAEFSQAKVDAAKAFTGGNRAILVSQDGHVVDGHHQWLAALQNRPKEPIRIIRLLAPIRYVLEKVKAMPSTVTANYESLAGLFEKIRPINPDAIAKDLREASADGLKEDLPDA